jgi:hypothetical protein
VRSTSPPEVGVPGRIHDVDERVAIVDGGVLRQNRDAPLTLEVDVVHGALGDAFVRPEDAALMKHGVHEGGFSVVDMGDDRHVPPEGVGDSRGRFLVRGHPTSIKGSGSESFKVQKVQKGSAGSRVR